MNDREVSALFAEAKLARQRAYAPYSNFYVGAAVLSDKGQIFNGCNVENASYGLTVCAERVAIYTAVASGHQKFKAIAVVGKEKDAHPSTDDISDQDKYTKIDERSQQWTACCGACRQVFVEFGTDWKVLLLVGKHEYVELNIEDLVPHCFGPKDLQKENPYPPFRIHDVQKEKADAKYDAIAK